MIDERAARITANPDVMVGKPTIRQTRITVETVLMQLAQGIAPEELLRNYPHLEQEDILACLEYAAEVLGEGKVYSLES